MGLEATFLKFVNTLSGMLGIKAIFGGNFCLSVYSKRNNKIGGIEMNKVGSLGGDVVMFVKYSLFTL